MGSERERKIARTPFDRRAERVAARPRLGPDTASDRLLAVQQSAGNAAARALVDRLLATSRESIAAASRPVPYQGEMETLFGTTFADTRAVTGRADLGDAGADGA